MSASNRRCIGRGLLAGTQLLLPDDKARYFHDIHDRVACNQVKCGSCGCWVRAFAGYRLRAWPRTKDEHRALYHETDPAASGSFTTANAGERFRVYACECDYHETGGILELEDSDHDEWACAGHPESATTGDGEPADTGAARQPAAPETSADAYTDPATPQELVARYDASERDFREAMLLGFDLSGACLSQANFAEADLSGAKFVGADLSWANFRGALLVGVDFTDANLSGCNLLDADLTDATLTGADLHGVGRPDLEPRAKQ